MASLRECESSFAAWLALERGLAPKTLEAYGRDVRFFVKFLADRGRAASGDIVRDDVAVQEMIRTQRPDGGWGNEFLTRQNAAALRVCGGEAAQRAYRKAMRNLRLRGASTAP